MFLKTLADPYVVAVGIPAIFLIVGALAKKLVRHTGFQREDFYMGAEATLAALSTGLINITDLVHQLQTSAANTAALGENIAGSTIFVGLTFIALLFILALQQSWAKAKPTWKEMLLLGVASNIIGIGLLFASIVLVKGV